MNLDKIKPRKHKPCNPLAPNCCLCRQPLFKTCLSSWAVRAPALSQSHPGLTGHEAVSLAAKLLPLLCLPGPAQRIFFFLVLNGSISFNKERTDGKQESECICWTPNWFKGFLSLAFSQQWQHCLCWAQGLVAGWLSWEDCCLDKVGIDEQKLLKFSGDLLLNRRDKQKGGETSVA